MTKKVIIIDDSLASLNLIKAGFNASDWEVYGTQNANDAIEMIYMMAPDIVITDAIMPVMGGFQLLKKLKKDPKTDKIPVIVYSCLDNKNSKFYIKEERGEYYLKKNEISELVELAQKVIEKNPVSNKYKKELLGSNASFNKIINENSEISNQEIPKQKPEKIEEKLDLNYDFSKSDNKILFDIFSLLYKILEYSLAVVCIHDFEKNKKIVYFDIRDILLSPYVQSKILQKFSAEDLFLFKKYRPSLKTIKNEDEFHSKMEFQFEHNKTVTGNIIFYSEEDLKWFENPNIEIIKNFLTDFFKKRYLSRTSKNSQKNTIINKYSKDFKNFNLDIQTDRKQYIAIADIMNFKDLQDNLLSEDIDIINSKISEKLMNSLSNNEKVLKNEYDEYSIVFNAKDDSSAKQRLEWILTTLDELNTKEYKMDIRIGACEFQAEGQMNFFEAQKLASEALDNTNNKNRVIIYGSK